MKDAESTIHEGSLPVPESLEKAYELTELISEHPGRYTLLMQRKRDGKRCVAKLFTGAIRD